jgi:sterol desaturase/sphingolipid hydroxylase (fatty acid hydroxylase superfamily)
MIMPAYAIRDLQQTFDRVTRSSRNYRFTPIVDVTGAIVFLAAGLRTPLPAAAKMAVIAGGLALWFPVEYALHRWLGHGPSSTARRGHAMHHADDAAPIAAPMFVVLTGFVAIWLVLWAVTSAAVAALFAGGLYAGYNYYTLVHHMLHHCEPLVLRLGGAGALRRHRAHHARHDVNFGVTSALWDRLFRTIAYPGGFTPADPPRRTRFSRERGDRR